MVNTRWLAAAVIIIVCVLGAAAVALNRSADDPFAAAAVTDPPFPPLTYGIQAFLWWDGGEVGLMLDWVRQMRFTHVKQTFAWRDLEPERGQWLWHESDRILSETERRDLHIVARLGKVPAWAAPDAAFVRGDDHDAPPVDMADWARYCGAVAERYRGRIGAYQLWNEPNLSREWGGREPDAAGYVALLAACSRAIRAADPDAILISAGLAPTGVYDASAHPDDIYLDALYRAGFQQYIDVVGVHAPGYGQPPEYGPDDAQRDGFHRSMTFRRVEDLRKIMLQHGDAARQMAILEIGWTTDQRNPEYAWHAVSEEEQAAYLRRAYEYAAQHWRPWVGLMSAIYLPKPVWTEADEEYWWSIAIPGTTLTRPAFAALVQMPKYCGAIVAPAFSPEEFYVEPENPCNVGF